MSHRGFLTEIPKGLIKWLFLLHHQGLPTAPKGRIQGGTGCDFPLENAILFLLMHAVYLYYYFSTKILQENLSVQKFFTIH